MKTRSVVVVAALGVVGAGAIWFATQGEATSAPESTASPKADVAAVSSVKVVNVDSVANDPERHAGRVAIEGVVAKVFPDRGAFTMIDASEFKQCGEVGCASLEVPVLVPRAEFEGELPKPEEVVLAIGEIHSQERGYKFVVEEVRRAGTTVVKRTKAPREP